MITIGTMITFYYGDHILTAPVVMTARMFNSTLYKVEGVPVFIHQKDVIIEGENTIEDYNGITDDWEDRDKDLNCGEGPDHY